MSRFLSPRRVGLLATAAAAAVFGAAGPAFADVSVVPPSVPQGVGANLTFRVTNTEPGPITRVKLLLPADSPIAEAYPLSVDDWAPLITNRRLLEPLATIHGGDKATETAAAITWIAMPGKALAPGKSTDLSVALGPTPMLSRMQFTVQVTEAGKTASITMPPAVLNLTPATAEQQAAFAAEHSGHGDTAGTAADGTASGATTAGGTAADAAADQAAYEEAVAQADQGPGLFSILGWILAALAAAVALVAVLRGRRRVSPAAAAPDAEPEAAEVKEPVGAGAGKARNSWRYQEPE